MELIKRFIQPYIKGRKKERMKTLTQYVALVQVKRGKLLKKGLDAILKNVQEGSCESYIKSVKGRKPKYNVLHKEIIEKCWGISGYICAERFHPILKICIEHFNEKGELKDYPLEVIE